MPTYGPNSPSTIVDDASSGTTTWSNPGNAAADDASYAEAVITSGFFVSTHWLFATNFGFSIPAGESIVGIEIRANGHRTTTGGTSQALYITVRPIKAGAVAGTNQASSNSINLNTDTTVTFGDPADLMGTTWTPADINSSGFGAAVQVQQTQQNPGTNTARVDHVSITIYTIEAAVGGVQTRKALLGVGV